MTAFYLRPSCANIFPVEIGSEKERQARLAGLIRIPDVELRKVTSLDADGRRRWAGWEQST